MPYRCPTVAQVRAVTGWHPALNGYWHAVALARDVTARPVAVSVLGVHMALARTKSGEWIALEDRCPHRHAPLSSGCVDGERIACPYHGWSFDRGGRLRDVPGLPEDSPLPAVGVRAFAACERDGVVWVRPGDAGEVQPNALASLADASTRRVSWRTTFQANVVDAMENVLDPLHTHFVHPGLVRREGRRSSVTATFSATADGFTVDYRSDAPQSGLLHRLFESRRTLERAHFSAPGSIRLEYGYADGSRICFDLHFTPTSGLETDVFACVHVSGRWAPAWAVRMFAGPLLRRVLEQDAHILALQSRNLRRHGPRHGASTALDIVGPALQRFWAGSGLPDGGEHRVVAMRL